MPVPNRNATARYAELGARQLLLCVALILLTVIASEAQADFQVGPIWPLTGIAFAAMWIGGVQWWPAVLLSQAGVSAYFGIPLLTALGAGWVETLAALLMLSGVQRFRITPDFWSVRNITRFLALAAAVSLVPATLFLVVMTVIERPLQEGVLGGWSFYWLGEVMSFLIFTPAVVVLSRESVLKRADWRRLAVSIAPLAVMSMVIPLMTEAVGETLFYVLLPLAVFAGAFGGMVSAIAASLLMVIVLLALSALGDQSLLDMWVRAAYVAATTLTVLLLAAFWRERQRIQEKLTYQALHDPLTGLANRLHFEERIKQLLSSQDPATNACLYLDLDKFKLMNDTCGHAAGDRLLESLAAELSALMPEGATLARLGGDEFGCLLPDTDEDGAVKLADRMGRSLDEIEFDTEESRVRVGGSVGITLFRSGSDDSPDTILARADVACYVAKDRDRGGYRVYRPDDEAMLRRHSAIRTISQVRNAMGSGEMTLFGQRIVRIDGKPASRERCELLLRMSGSSPGEFLPLANRYGMMREIDEWVMEQAGCVLAAHPDVALSVNVSSRTLDSGNFHAMVMNLRDRYGFRPGQLCLEITETVALENLLGAVKQLVKLRQEGFELALDDFGAGVASFGYLQQLPVSQVKLDGRFVRDLSTNPSSQVIVRSLVDLARIREIECIAEGVQSRVILGELRNLDVKFAQGFALHRPEPLDGLYPGRLTSDEDLPGDPAGLAWQGSS